MEISYRLKLLAMISYRLELLAIYDIGKTQISVGLGITMFHSGYPVENNKAL